MKIKSRRFPNHLNCEKRGTILINRLTVKKIIRTLLSAERVYGRGWDINVDFHNFLPPKRRRANLRCLLVRLQSSLNLKSVLQAISRKRFRPATALETIIFLNKYRKQNQEMEKIEVNSLGSFPCYSSAPSSVGFFYVENDPPENRKFEEFVSELGSGRVIYKPNELFLLVKN